MSEQREIINPATGAAVSVADALAREPEYVKRMRAEKKARLARVLDRGVIVDRLHVDLPPHLYGEWVPNDKMAIHEMETLGFKIDTEYARKMPVFEKGDGNAVLGDVTFMICERETKELIDELRADEFQRRHGKQGKGQKEEREFRAQVETTGLPIVDESRSRSARREELREALQSAHGSSTPTSGTIIK